MKLKNIAFIMFSAVMIAVVGSSCGTKKTAVADTAVSASDKVKGRVDGKKESNAAALEQLNYVRRVSDNAVYADNIVFYFIVVAVEKSYHLNSCFVCVHHN